MHFQSKSTITAVIRTLAYTMGLMYWDCIHYTITNINITFLSLICSGNVEVK